MTMFKTKIIYLGFIGLLTLCFFLPSKVSASESLIELSSGRQTISIGQETEYFVKFSNNSQQSFSNIKISNPIPAGTIYVENSATGEVQLANDILTWTIPTLDPGASISYTYRVRMISTPEPLPIYISSTGNDNSSGKTLNEPFKTLERARDEIRSLKQTGQYSKPIEVILAGGEYSRDKFVLGPNDSGTLLKPISYRAEKDKIAELSGGKKIDNLRKINLNDPGWTRIPSTARPNTYISDLKALGINDIGGLTRRGMGLPEIATEAELFFKDSPMTLARWPNNENVKIAGIPGGLSEGTIESGFYYDDPRPASWQSTNDIWMHGYWGQDWADSHEKIISIDTASKLIKTENVNYGFKKDQPYFYRNILEELDSPGEYFIDRQNSLLYFWPTDSNLSQPPILSLYGESIISMTNASHIKFEGITIKHGRFRAISGSGLSNVIFSNLKIKNFGTAAVRVTTPQDCLFENSEISNIGFGGIGFISSGDRNTLKSGGNLIANNKIYNYARLSKTYRPAVSVSGVGTKINNNLIHTAPHMAIQFSGNNHTIEKNEIHHVCTETGDAGAIYSGRDWTFRGNVINQNYFHDITNNINNNIGVSAVYLDDMLSGTRITNNIFEHINRGILVGGGRDNIVENNIFYNVGNSIFVDGRGLGWAKASATPPDGIMYQNLANVPYQDPIWSAAYPALANILSDEPAAPKNNIIGKNISYKHTNWLYLDTYAQGYVQPQANFTDQDPLFVNADESDFTLKSGSPALNMGFQQINMSQIGPNW